MRYFVTLKYDLTYKVLVNAESVSEASDLAQGLAVLDHTLDNAQDLALLKHVSVISKQDVFELDPNEG